MPHYPSRRRRGRTQWSYLAASAASRWSAFAAWSAASAECCCCRKRALSSWAQRIDRRPRLHPRSSGWCGYCDEPSVLARNKILLCELKVYPIEISTESYSSRWTRSHRDLISDLQDSETSVKTVTPWDHFKKQGKCYCNHIVIVRRSILQINQHFWICQNCPRHQNIN